MPVSDSARGSRPLSRFAMQIARDAPPPTGPKRLTEQVIRRRMKWGTDSLERADRSHGPTPVWARVGAIVTSPRIRGIVTTVARNRLGTGRLSDASINVDPAAGATVLAVVAVEEPFVDEVAAERCVIGEE